MLGEATALLTDLYQLNMLAAYRDHGVSETAIFERFIRRLPARRGFLMARDQLARLPAPLRQLEGFSYRAAISRRLRDLADQLDRRDGAAVAPAPPAA